MKKLIVLLCLFSVMIISCARSEPAENVVNPNADIPLTLIAAYNTSVSEPSALAYNSKTNTLFTVSDGNSTVYEMTFTGTVLRSFVIPSSDLEGIVFSANCDTFYVAEETNRIITKYLSTGAKLYSFPFENVVTDPKHGPEGITLNTLNNHLFVLNERDPRMLVEYVNKTEISRRQILYTSDCSDIFYDAAENCFWVLSDESAKIIKMTPGGDYIAGYSLPKLKMEGIVVVQGKIYTINDEDGKLYVFNKPQ